MLQRLGARDDCPHHRLFAGVLDTSVTNERSILSI
jgi:hypothetical protein